MLSRPEPRKTGWFGYLALCAIGLSLVLTWLGPDASGGFGTLNALVFWFAHVATGLGLLAGAQLMLGRIPRIARLPPFAQVALGGLAGAVAFVPAAFGLDQLFQPPGTVDEVGSGILPEVWTEFSEIVVPFSVFWVLLNAPTLVQLEKPEDARGDRKKPEEDLASEFWTKVPKSLGRDLIALSAELHYLRVYMTEGDALILFAFGRAVELLDSPSTCQIHRSHWVSLAHVEGIESAKGAMTCVLSNELRLPVSRRHRKALKLGLGARA